MLGSQFGEQVNRQLFVLWIMTKPRFSHVLTFVSPLCLATCYLNYAML